MHEFLKQIMAKFNSPKAPKPKYFESLKDLREFQRAHPNYQGPLCMMLDGKETPKSNA